MPYLIETYDKPDHQSLRQRIRPVHLEYLEMNKNKLLASGAKLDDAGQNASGGIYILDTESRSDAEAFIAEDPFTKTELFQRIEITRWRKAFSNFESYLWPPDSPASTSRYLSPQRKNRR
jgi:uncharacterized protein